jgi:hypothetical protein
MGKFRAFLTGIFENLRQYVPEIPENPEISDFVPDISDFVPEILE